MFSSVPLYTCSHVPELWRAGTRFLLYFHSQPPPTSSTPSSSITHTHTQIRLCFLPLEITTSFVTSVQFSLALYFPNYFLQNKATTLKNDSSFHGRNNHSSHFAYIRSIIVILRIQGYKEVNLGGTQNKPNYSTNCHKHCILLDTDGGNPTF